MSNYHDQLMQQAYEFNRKKEYDKAYPLLFTCASANYAGAQNNLGNLYYYGRGVAQSRIMP